MWPIKSPSSETFLALVIKAQRIYLAHLRLQMTGLPIAQLLSYQSITLNSYDMHEGVVYNGAAFEYALNQMRGSKKVLLALSPPCVKEMQLWCSTAAPASGDLFFPDRERSVWQSHYLYPAESGGFYFYISALYPWMIHQYQTIAARTRKELIRIESTFSALLAAYKIRCAQAYRATQLRHDFERVQGDFSQIFQRDSIARMLHMQDCLAGDEDNEILAAFIGLCAAERVMHE